MNPLLAALSNSYDPLTWIAPAVPGFPILAFAVLTFSGKRLHHSAGLIGSIGTGLALLAAVICFSQVWEQPAFHFQADWLTLPAANGVLRFKAGLLLDNLAAVMLVLASFISLLVQIYSVSYLAETDERPRYFAHLNLFTGAMLLMVLSDNLLWLFICWELVGFSSYLLIGYWRHKQAAGVASVKAFLLNRVADLALLAGLLMVWAWFGTFDLTELRETLSGAIPNGPWLLYRTDLLANLVPASLPVATLTVLGLCLFAGCVGKSAQFPLQVWLPDAMAGPTPVSALLHAATMVAAGVYLLARCHVFFTADALTVIASIGAVTALLGALSALTENDLKRALAYSTISQLGYMVMGMGAGAYGASLLHLVAHAFAKAGLFLLAGIIIHYYQHQSHQDEEAAEQHQDMRLMGGLRNVLPVVFICYLACSAALAGLPFTTGFLSKDALLLGTWQWAQVQNSLPTAFAMLIPICAFGTVVITAAYLTRQVWHVFLKPAAVEATDHSEPGKEKALVSRRMLVPVLLLSVLCGWVWLGLNPLQTDASWLFRGLQSGLSRLSEDSFLKTGPAHSESWVPVLATVLSIVGISFTIWYQQRKAARSSAATANWQRLLVMPNLGLNYFYAWLMKTLVLGSARSVNEIERTVLVRSLDALGKTVVVLAALTSWGDRVLVDGSVRLTARLAQGFGKGAAALQSGRLQSQYLVALLGLAGLLLYVVLS